jgi:hypothetical protein
MADFRIRFTSGVALEPWSDPPHTTGGRDLPSRVNAQPDHDPTREVAAQGVQVELTATVRGVGDAPLDGALTDGNLFDVTMVEWPGPGPAPPFAGAAGQSSVQRFTPNAAGHYTCEVFRPEHGAIYAHIDVDS